MDTIKICVKRLHRRRIHLLLWSLCGYGKEVIEFFKENRQYEKETLRCDQKADCDDQSDEASCQIVYINPEQYLKESIFLFFYPPPRSKEVAVFGVC